MMSQNVAFVVCGHDKLITLSNGWEGREGEALEGEVLSLDWLRECQRFRPAGRVWMNGELLLDRLRGTNQRRGERGKGKVAAWRREGA